MKLTEIQSWDLFTEIRDRVKGGLTRGKHRLDLQEPRHWHDQEPRAAECGKVRKVTTTTTTTTGTSTSTAEDEAEGIPPNSPSCKESLYTSKTDFRTYDHLLDLSLPHGRESLESHGADQTSAPNVPLATRPDHSSLPYDQIRANSKTAGEANFHGSGNGHGAASGSFPQRRRVRTQSQSHRRPVPGISYVRLPMSGQQRDKAQQRGRAATGDGKFRRTGTGPGQEEDFSVAVRDRLATYTRTGQACDRCKVR